MQSSPSSTRPVLTAARLTPRGRGAVASVRVRGNLALLNGEGRPPLFRAANRRPIAAQPIDRIAFGHWGIGVGEEVVLCRIADDAVEIHSHGGEAAVGRILSDLETRGAAIVPWSELIASERGLLAAECDAALAQAATFRTAEILLEQRAGALRNAIEALLAEARPAMEQTSEQKAQPGARVRPVSSHVDRPDSDFASLTSGLDEFLAWADFGRHLVAPWEVVLVGRPNVGKSSLTNALVGFARSIVFDRPGTTRDVVTAETALDGWPVRLADTAGLREEADDLESAGIARARQLLARADLVVLLVDIGEPPGLADRELIAAYPGALCVAHKCDLADRWGSALPAGALRVSSHTGEGVEELARAIAERLVPRVPPAGTAIPFTDRQITLLKDARAATEPGAIAAALTAILG